MNDIIKKKFELGKINNTYRRIDNEHHLNIFIGYSENGLQSMVITVDGKCKSIESSKAIEVKLFKKSNNETNLSFNLLDEEKESIFYKFCEDIIESSRDVSTENAMRYIINRWNSWRYVFKKPINNLLSENQIVGLLGELLYLKNYMIPKFGYDKSIKSWQGPYMSHKDFEFDRTWHEIKTIRSGSLTVKISSIEQLDSDVEGFLDIIVLDKTNEKVNNSISLNKYISKIKNEIPTFELNNLFIEKLGQAGYFPDEEYDNYNYRFIKNRTYVVDERFPRLLYNNLKNGIVKVSYDILLNEIEKFIYVGEEYGVSGI